MILMMIIVCCTSGFYGLKIRLRYADDIGIRDNGKHFGATPQTKFLTRRKSFLVPFVYRYRPHQASSSYTSISLSQTHSRFRNLSIIPLSFDMLLHKAHTQVRMKLSTERREVSHLENTNQNPVVLSEILFSVMS